MLGNHKGMRGLTRNIGVQDVEPAHESNQLSRRHGPVHQVIGRPALHHYPARQARSRPSARKRRGQRRAPSCHRGHADLP